MLKVPLAGLKDRLDGMAAEGCSIFAPLYSFAMSLELAASLT